MYEKEEKKIRIFWTKKWKINISIMILSIFYSFENLYFLGDDNVIVHTARGSNILKMTRGSSFLKLYCDLLSKLWTWRKWVIPRYTNNFFNNFRKQLTNDTGQNCTMSIESLWADYILYTLTSFNCWLENRYYFD